MPDKRAEFPGGGDFPFELFPKNVFPSGPGFGLGTGDPEKKKKVLRVRPDPPQKKRLSGPVD